MLQRKLLTEDHTLFFMHIPKTAGTTLNKILSSYYPQELICPLVFWPDFLKISDKQVQSYRFFRAHFQYNAVERMQQPVRLMTFLRDPIERSISQYKEYQRTKTTPFYREANQLSFDEFLRKYPEKLTNIALIYLANGTQDLDLALKNLLSIDFVGITERFDDSLAMLYYVFSLPPNMAYLKHNVSAKRIKSSELSQDTLDLLLELNALEYQLYNNAVELFQERYSSLLAQLLNDDYLSCGFAHRNKEPVEEVHFTFTEGMFDRSGWHQVEYHATVGYFNWSGSSPSSYINFNLNKSHTYKLQLKIINYADEAMLDSLYVTVNGFRINLTKTHKGGKHFLFSCLIESHQIKNQDAVQIGFHLPNVARIGDDPRALGLCYNWIKITPVVDDA